MEEKEAELLDVVPWYYEREVPFVPCCDAHPEVSCVGKACLDARVIGRYGLSLNLPFHALSALLPLLLATYRRRTLPSPREWLVAAKRTARNTMWSTLFFCSFGFFFSALYCLLRNLRKRDDDWSPFLSGVLSGSAMLCEQEERRTELLSFAMPRFAEVVWGLAEKRGYVRAVPYGAPVLFALALGVVMHTYRREPRNLKPIYRTVIKHAFAL
jgi:hypothetical protein